MTTALGFHPLDPLCSPLRCLEWLGIVAPVPPHLPVSQLDEKHYVEYLPAAVVVDSLNDPQSIPDQHPAQLDSWRRGVGFLERSHVLSTPDGLSRLGHLRHVVLVAQRVLLLSAQAREKLR